MNIPLQINWGEKYGEITAGFDCGKCGKRIRSLEDGYIEFLAGTPQLRCRRKRCAGKDYRSGGLWLDLAVLLEGLLLGLGVKGVTIKPSEYVPIAGSVSKSEWVPIKKKKPSGKKKKVKGVK